VPPAREHPDQAESRAYLPYPAAALAEIRDRQPRELVATGFEPHPFEQLVRAALVLGALVREPADVLHASRQPVALELQLPEAQQARSAEGFVDATRGIYGDVRE
jgi:hypothetical protein